MFDIRLIRDNPAAFDAGLGRRGLPPASRDVLELDERRRSLTTRLQASQERRNAASREIGAAKARRTRPRPRP